MRRATRVNKVDKIAFGQFVKVLAAKKGEYMIIQQADVARIRAFVCPYKGEVGFADKGCEQR